MLEFTDVQIEKIFGADDAENENDDRFLEYFYENGAYESLCSGLPIRILVGHKGVGKSALLKRAYLEESKSNLMPIWMRPNELTSISIDSNNNNNFNLRVEAWKKGILRHVAEFIVDKIYGKKLIKTAPEISNANVSDLIKIIQRCYRDNPELKIENNTVYIDDIDRGWSASKDDITNISALLNAMRDISSPALKSGIKFRIGLRSDVYFLVRTSDESTDKIERNVIWLKWSNDDILRVIAMRIQTYFEPSTTQKSLRNVSQQYISDNILSKVIDPRFKGLGHWSDRPIHNVLLSLTRARPRDIVKLLHGAAKQAYSTQNQIISSTNLERCFESYSQERLQDIVNEFRSEMPEIEKLLLNMKPAKKMRRTAESFKFSTDQLNSKINDIMRRVTLRFTNGKSISARSIVQFLYKIDFITARIETNGNIERKYFDQSRFLASETVEFGYGWEIHPAYRWALQPNDIQDVINSVMNDL